MSKENKKDIKKEITIVPVSGRVLLKEGIYEICIIYGNDGEDIFSSTGVMVEIK